LQGTNYSSYKDLQAMPGKPISKNNVKQMTLTSQNHPSWKRSWDGIIMTEKLFSSDNTSFDAQSEG